MVEGTMTNEIELIVVGRLTDDVKRALYENFNNIRSKGFKRVNFRFFTGDIPLRYLEEVRDLLLSNMILSINLYEYELKSLSDVLNQLIKQGKNVILVGDTKAVPHQVADLLKDLKK